MDHDRRPAHPLHAGPPRKWGGPPGRCPGALGQSYRRTGENVGDTRRDGALGLPLDALKKNTIVELKNELESIRGILKERLWCITSFDSRFLSALRKQTRGLRVLLMTSLASESVISKFFVFELMARAACVFGGPLLDGSYDGVAIPWTSITPRFCESVSNAKPFIVAGSVEDAQAFRKCQLMGVLAVFTDNPKSLIDSGGK